MGDAQRVWDSFGVFADGRVVRRKLVVVTSDRAGGVGASAPWLAHSRRVPIAPRWSDQTSVSYTLRSMIPARSVMIALRS
jgi:hypothetical protein